MLSPSPSVPLCLRGDYERASQLRALPLAGDNVCAARDADIHHRDTETLRGTETFGKIEGVTPIRPVSRLGRRTHIRRHAMDLAHAARLVRRDLRRATREESECVRSAEAPRVMPSTIWHLPRCARTAMREINIWTTRVLMDDRTRFRLASLTSYFFIVAWLTLLLAGVAILVAAVGAILAGRYLQLVALFARGRCAIRCLVRLDLLHCRSDHEQRERLQAVGVGNGSAQRTWPVRPALQHSTDLL
jgi:hypothetical protein